MPYSGPPSGVINIIPRTTSGTVSATPVTPSIDIGGDGDYCLDLNTNTLFGPKDSQATDPWPLTGLTIGNGRYTWRGAWSSSNSYNAGDIVHYSGSHYLCLKSVTYGTPAAWSAGNYDAGTYVTYSGTLYVAVNNATSAHTPGSAATIWEQANPQQDAASSYAAQDNWTSLSASVEADTYFTITAGPTRLAVPQRVLLNGSYPIAPKGIQTGVTFPNYLVDSLAIDSSSTLAFAGPSFTTPAYNDPGASNTVELKASGVTASPSNTGYSRVTVDQYGRITAASNGLQTTWETRSTAESALTSANFAVEFTGSTALTCTLAAPSSAVAGRVHVIKNSTTQNLTVQCTGTPANSINNSTSYTIPTGTTVMFIASDTSASGQGWRVITNVLVNQANTFTAAQTIQPATDGTVLSVTNNAGTYSPFAVSTSTGITTVKQGLQFSSVFDSTTAAEFKASDSTTVLGVDTTNKVITSSTQATASGTALSSTNKVVDQRALNALNNPVNTAFGESITRLFYRQNVTVGSGAGQMARIVMLKSGTLQFLSVLHTVNATHGTNNDADYRLCAWNSSGTLIGVSANIKDALTSTSAASGTGWVGMSSGGANNQIFAALTAVSGQSLAVNGGDVIYGGIMCYQGTGGTPVVAQFGGTTTTSSLTRIDPPMSLAITSGYTGGNPANLTTTVSAFNISSSGTFNINRLGTTNQSSNVLYFAAW